MTFRRTFIIHLTRATRREPQVAGLLARIGPSAEVLPAVDGAQLSKSDYDSVLGPPIRPSYPFSLRKAEVATFLDHRACWRRIVSDDLDAALILEDDASLSKQFFGALDFARWHLPEGAFVRFPIQERESAEVILAEALESPVRIRLQSGDDRVGSRKCAAHNLRSEAWVRKASPA